MQLKIIDELKQIKAVPKCGNEHLSFEEQNINYSLMDFWRWSTSDILSNATRGRFAEFIVGTAIDLNPENVRDEWDAYDLKTEEGIKIEVKSASYIQTWKQKCYSRINFRTKLTKYWDPVTNIEKPEARRHADLYVFCHLKHKDQHTIDPLKMEQWDFYVLPTYRLDHYERSQSSITLNSLRKLTCPLTYNELKSQIQLAYKEQRNYLLLHT